MIPCFPHDPVLPPQIVMTQIERKNFLLYFTKAWNFIDFCSNSLLVACMIIWWIFVKK